MAVVDGSLADARRPGGGVDGRRAAGVGPAGLPAARAAAAGVRARGRRAARRRGAVVGTRAAGPARGRLVHGGRGARVRLRAPVGGARHQRAPRAGPHGRRGRAARTEPDGRRGPPRDPVRPRRRRDGGPVGGGVDGARRAGVHRAVPALRRLPGAGRVRLVRRGPARRRARRPPEGPDVHRHRPRRCAVASWRCCATRSARCRAAAVDAVWPDARQLAAVRRRPASPTAWSPATRPRATTTHRPTGCRPDRAPPHCSLRDLVPEASRARSPRRPACPPGWPGSP